MGCFGFLQLPSAPMKSIPIDAARPAPLMTFRQLAERLGVSLNTARKLVDDGHLTTVRVQVRSVRIRVTEVEQFIAQGGLK